VGLALAAVADEAERCSGADPAGGAELGEGGGVEVRVGVGVEVGEPFGPGEAGIGDAAGAAAGVAVVALGEQQLGQKRRVGLLLAFRDVDELAGAVADRREAQCAGGGVDRGRGRGSRVDRAAVSADDLTCRFRYDLTCRSSAWGSWHGWSSVR
jgi:hypothetical protein